MPLYKLYIVTGDGHIGARHDENAADLDSIVLTATKLGGGKSEVEIWEGANFLGCVMKDGRFRESPVRHRG